MYVKWCTGDDVLGAILGPRMISGKCVYRTGDGVLGAILGPRMISGKCVSVSHGCRLSYKTPYVPK